MNPEDISVQTDNILNLLCMYVCAYVLCIAVCVFVCSVSVENIDCSPCVELVALLTTDVLKLDSSGIQI